jgi:hypothetical protein
LIDIKECPREGRKVLQRSEVLSMILRCAAAWLLCVAAGSAWAQEVGSDDVAEGHHLATLICSACHIAASNQPFEPILRPPAPSFASIAQGPSSTGVAMQKFLATTHRNIGNAQGMPNPRLLDYQVRQLTAYLLSLRKRP